MPDPTTTSLPGLGATVGYFASSATEPMPAQIAQDLGAGVYNLRVVGTDGNAFAKESVPFIAGTDTPPATGEYCMLAGSARVI